MAAIREGGWSAKLFSSALFCLWLSIASVTVWFDLPEPPAPVVDQSSESAPVDPIPGDDRNRDAA